MKKIPVVYIIGSGHCGSTLLDLVLDSHSKIIGVGELYQYPKQKKEQKGLICTCGKKVIECNFWKQVFEDIEPKFNFKVFRSKKDFLLNKKKFFELDKGPDRKINLKNYIELHEEIYNRILHISGEKVVVDSSKDPDRAELLLGSNKLSIILLHLVRDGRAVAWSYKKKYKRTVMPINGGKRWFFKNIKTEIIKKRNNVENIFVKYEDFCKNPEKILRRILKKLNLEFEPEMLNFRDKIHHQIEGNRLRFSKSKKIRVDNSWKKEMPILDRLKFNFLFGWLNLIYKLRK